MYTVKMVIYGFSDFDSFIRLNYLLLGIQAKSKCKTSSVALCYLFVKGFFFFSFCIASNQID